MVATLIAGEVQSQQAIFGASFLALMISMDRPPDSGGGACAPVSGPDHKIANSSL